MIICHDNGHHISVLLLECEHRQSVFIVLYYYFFIKAAAFKV